MPNSIHFVLSSGFTNCLNMNNAIKTILTLCAVVVLPAMAKTQGMKLGEVIMVSTSALKKDVKPPEFQASMKEIVASWNKGKSVISMNLFQADRGKRKGEFLVVCGANKATDLGILPEGSPFTDKVLSARGSKLGRPSDFLENVNDYTQYRLIGAEKFKSLPVIGILGIHYIKVKENRTVEFDKFVTEKLNPAVGQLLPDMRLFYYKAVAGEHIGTYVTIFAITSTSARDQYWPSGAPEREIVKQTFRPLKQLAVELGSFLEEGSYLGPESGGGAAYFESKEWTDFIYQPLSD